MSDGRYRTRFTDDEGHAGHETAKALASLAQRVRSLQDRGLAAVYSVRLLITMF